MQLLREATKRNNGLFFRGQATKALPPPLLELSGHKIFTRIFLELQKTVFFLSGRATRKTVIFLRLTLTNINCILSLYLRDKLDI